VRASELLAKIERAGGGFTIETDGTIRYQRVPRQLLPELKQQSNLVKALIKERAAARAWELSGRDPNWWRE
jgi:hypothetical protein